MSNMAFSRRDLQTIDAKPESKVAYHRRRTGELVHFLQLVVKDPQRPSKTGSLKLKITAEEFAKADGKTKVKLFLDPGLWNLPTIASYSIE